jgi:hypothetical protein
VATETLRPNANVTQAWVVSDYANIDEVTADDTGTQNYCMAGGGGISRFGLPSLSGLGTITNVRIYYRAMGAISTNCTFVYGYGVKTHGTDYCNYDSQNTDWTNEYRDLATNPYTGVAWTISEIDDLQLIEYGYTESYNDGKTGYQSVVQSTQLYAVVTGEERVLKPYPITSNFKSIITQ